MRILPVLLLTLGILLPPPAFADPACKMQRTATLAVEMFGQRKLRPVVQATINGVPAKMEFDTGAASSLMTASSAPKFNLRSVPVPEGMEFRSSGQKYEATLAEAEEFRIAELALRNVNFIVADTIITEGADGLFGSADMGNDSIEIDLPGNEIRFFAPCDAGYPAYRSADAQRIDIEPVTADAPRIFGMVKVNGVALRAMFDTGTPITTLTAKAAAKAGVTPGMPSVVESGTSRGIGPTLLKKWTGQFTSISIGNETLLNPKLDFAEKPNASADLLIGADFFTTHRVLVSKRTSKLYFTYSGGTLFGTEPQK